MVKLIQPAASIVRDNLGEWQHPEFTAINEGASQQELEQWLASQAIAGVEVQDLFDHLATLPQQQATSLRERYEQTGDFSELPLPPAPTGEGWFLVSVHPSPEFGPVAMWVTRTPAPVGHSAPPRPELTPALVSEAAHEVIAEQFPTEQLPDRIHQIVTIFMGASYTRATKDMVWALEKIYGWVIEPRSELHDQLSRFAEIVEQHLQQAERAWASQAQLQQELAMGDRLDLGILRCTGTVVGLDPIVPHCYLVREDCNRNQLHVVPFEQAKERR